MDAQISKEKKQWNAFLDYILIGDFVHRVGITIFKRTEDTSTRLILKLCSNRIVIAMPVPVPVSVPGA